jgi:hypothetical protein
LLRGLTVLSESDTEKLGEARKSAKPETDLHDDRDEHGEQDLRVKQPRGPAQDKAHLITSAFESVALLSWKT